LGWGFNMKHRLIKEVVYPGRTIYYTEVRFMLFFWTYCEGSMCTNYNDAHKSFSNLKNGAINTGKTIMEEG
jgi:hypothetical protein